MLLVSAVTHAAAAGLPAPPGSPSTSSAFLPGGPPRNVTYDHRSFLVNGKRQLLLSGGIHYTRVLPEDWERVLRMAKGLGLNTIQTYTMWNFHEHERGSFDLASPRRNLTRFLEIAGQLELNVVVRIGPYVCGEWYGGGIPLWVRQSGTSCYRCADPIWESEMARAVKLFVDAVRPMLASNGGPVIMLQVENEYNGDQNYLTWAVEMAHNLTSDVPWILCHDVDLCSKINAAIKDNTVCTINGFWEEQETFVSQPSPGWIHALQSQNPNQPLAWTEDQGWFDQWSVAQRVRYSSDQIYGVARWFAYGGAYHNHYMLTGGSNFERWSGGEVVTAYAPDTTIDYLLLRHQPRYDFYGKMYMLLDSLSDHLTSLPIPAPKPLNGTLHGPATLGRGNATSSYKLDLETCYQYPDPTQEFVFAGAVDGAPGTLSVKAYPDLCVSSTVGNDGVQFVPCTNARTGLADESVLWTISSQTQHIASVSTSPCQKPHASGQCHQCIDLRGGGQNIDLWDCKEPSDPQPSNQAFVYTPIDNHIESTAQQECLFASSTAPPPPAGTGAEVHEYGDIAFLSNYMVDQSMTVDYAGRSYFLTNHSVLLINSSSGAILFNTSDIDDTVARSSPHTTAATYAATSWSVYAEPVGKATRSSASSSGPTEQLLLTENESDYLWYSTNVTIAGQGKIELSGYYGTRTYAYLDGKLVNSNLDPGAQTTFTVEVPFAAGSSSPARRLDILSVAMGLQNGGLSPSMGKGLTTVKVDGTNITAQPFTMQWNLTGEAKAIYTADGAKTVAWQPASSVSANASLLWYKGLIDIPDLDKADPNKTAFALNLTSMNKGAAYVNGFNIGRYFLIPGHGVGCAPPHHGPLCYMHFKGDGRPTQSLYHIPNSILQPTGNLVVLFEETAAVLPGPRKPQDIAIVALDSHPNYD